MGFQLLNRDCLEAIRKMPAESVDAIVTDPPYALTQASRKGSSRKPGTGPFGRHTLGEDRGFMGKTWDNGALVHDPAFWAEVLRVAKPGAHLIAFGGTRTFHRLMVAIEDAGWEIRDTLGWLYGSGFPKSMDVGKAIDKAAGADRIILGTQDVGPDMRGGNYENGDGRMIANITAPATEAARQWTGWGTALKPAWEPIILARKPIRGTVSENVQTHGTGALNIDACRVQFAGEDDEQEAKAKNQHGDFGSKPRENRIYGKDEKPQTNYNAPGRFPANLIHDGSDEVLSCFPATGSRGHAPASRPAGGISCDGHSAQTG